MPPAHADPPAPVRWEPKHDQQAIEEGHSAQKSVTVQCTRKYAEVLTTWSKCSCVCSMVFFLGLAALYGVGVASGPVSSQGQFLAVGELPVQQFFAREVALDEVSKNESRIVPPQSQEISSLMVFFTADEGSIWTPSNMLKLYDTQQGLIGEDPARFSIKDYKDFCLILPGTSGCAAPSSPLSIFFGDAAYSRSDVQLLNQSRIDAALALAVTPDGLRDNDFFFDKDFRAAAGATPPAYVGSITRLTISFGGPVNATVQTPTGAQQKYINIYVEEEEQEDEFKEWVVQYNDFFSKPDPAGITVDYYNNEAGNAEVNSLIQGDFILAAAAGVIVVVIVCLQTGSYSLAIVGMLNVVLSFPVGLTLYHGLLGIEHSTQLNQLTLYIILGIGADDIFVLVDAWRQSELESDDVVGPPGPGGLAQRFEWVWTRAAASMFVTSATTFVAFVMTALSPIPAIGAFGTLAALMVLVNYVGIITFYSAYLVVWHKYFEHTCCRCCAPLCMPPFCRCCACCDILVADGCCFCCPGRPSARVVASLGTNTETAPNDTLGGTAPSYPNPTPTASILHASTKQGDAVAASAAQDEHGSASVAASSIHKNGSQPAHEDKDVEEHRCMERFCFKQWAPLVFKVRWPIMVAGAVIFILSIVGTAFLAPPDQQASGLPAESELQKAIDNFDRFPASAASFLVRADIMYGIDPEEPLNRDDIDRNDPDERGSLRLDTAADFAVHRAEVQRYLVEEACVGFAEARVPGQGVPFALFGDQVECWLHDWALWRNATMGPGSMYADFATPAAFKQDVQTWVATLNSDAALSVVQRAGGLLGDGGRIEWVAFSFNTTIPIDTGIVQLTAFAEAWQGKMDAVNAGAPLGARRGFAASGDFAWVSTSEVLISSTFQSIGISFAVAVVFLLVFSGNLIVAGIASGVIACIVLGVLALIAAIPGLELGTVESICATIVVGLAVDYTVHLAHSFQGGGIVGRFERSRHSLFEIGVSVVGGAATSLTAAFVLFFAKLLFFQRFGQLIFMTLMLSIVLSTTLFIAALMLVGPVQHPDGDLLHVLRLVWFACTGTVKSKPGGATAGAGISPGAPNKVSGGSSAPGPAPKVDASSIGQQAARKGKVSASHESDCHVELMTEGGDVELVHVRAAHGSMSEDKA